MKRALRWLVPALGSALIACGDEASSSGAPDASTVDGGGVGGGTGPADAAAGGGGIELSGAGAHPNSNISHDATYCHECVAAKCSPELDACEASSHCVALRDFACRAGPATCAAAWQERVKAHSAGLALFDALSICVSAECGKTSCATDYPACGSFVHDKECASCLNGACCSEGAAEPPTAACSDAHCAATCGVAICDSGVFARSVACAGCLGAGCCIELGACSASPACFRCLTENICDGASAAAAVSARGCAEQKCASSCE